MFFKTTLFFFPLFLTTVSLRPVMFFQTTLMMCWRSLTGPRRSLRSSPLRTALTQVKKALFTATRVDQLKARLPRRDDIKPHEGLLQSDLIPKTVPLRWMCVVVNVLLTCSWDPEIWDQWKSGTFSPFTSETELLGFWYEIKK